MSKLILKKDGNVHFTKDFGEGTTSDRVILPGQDDCLVKVTVFKPKAGFSIEGGINYPCDETVYVVSGEIRLHLGIENRDIDLKAGDMYHVTAFYAYGVTAQ